MTDHLGNMRDESSEIIKDIHGGGRHAFRFLKSIWFWIIAAPVNALLFAGIMSLLAPWLYVGFPGVPGTLAGEPKAIVIDKDRQAAYGYEYGKLKHRFVILTGRKEHETPVGQFRITRKIADYYSREFNNASMPNTLFFLDQRGIAMHAGHRVEWKWLIREITGNLPNIGSRGCVRLTHRGSERMFQWADIGTPILVTNLRSPAPKPVDAPAASASRQKPGPNR